LLNSAVDTHVGKHLFDKTIGPNGLLKGKTRVLVTNCVSVLPKVDQIIVLKNGFVSESGTFEALIAKNGYFAEFVTEYLLEHSDTELENGDKTIVNQLRERLKPLIDKSIDESICQSISGSVVSRSESDRIRKRFSKQSSSLLSEKSFKDTKYEETVKQKPMMKTSGKLTETEKSAEGSVGLTVYRKYIHLIGLAFNTVIVVSFIISNVAQVLAGLWLSKWSDDSLDANKMNDTNLRHLRLGVYAGIGIIDAVFNLIANICVILGCIRAAKQLHNTMLDRVLRAPMLFYGKTC
jgi:ATP-binding cassette subfamily C (CFTR/MRP) protein 1